jgi:hypothetical protein
MRQPTDHQSRHRQIHECLAGFRQPLVVLAQAAILPHPRERTLNDPALRQDMKAARDRWRLLPWCDPDSSETSPPMLDDLDVPVRKVFCGPAPKSPVVVAVGPQLADRWKSFGHAVENLNGTVAISYVGRMHLQRQHQALRIHDQVAFAAFDLLAAVISTCRSTDATRFDRLTIDDRRARLYLATEATPHCFAQGGVDGLPHTQQPPQSEVVVDGFPLREVVRQPFPATAGFGHLEHGVQQSPARNRRLPAIGFRFRHQERDDRPFGVR